MQQMHKYTSLLLSAAQALWNAYCFPGLAGLRLFVCKRKQICLAVAFSDTSRLECLIQSFGGLERFVCICTNQPHCCFQRQKCTGMPNTKRWWPRIVCLQIKIKTHGNLVIFGGDSLYIIHQMHIIDHFWSREKRGKGCALGKKTNCSMYSEVLRSLPWLSRDISPLCAKLGGLSSRPPPDPITLLDCQRKLPR